MPLSLIKRLIDEAIDNGVSYINPELSNEPLMDPRIIDIVRYIRSKSESVHIIFPTNARLLKPKIQKQLAEFSNIRFDFNVQCLNCLPAYYITTFLKIKRPFNSTAQIWLYKNFNPNWKRCREYWNNQDLTVRCFVANNRAGNVPFDDGFPRSKMGNKCQYNYPETTMFILWNGDAILCCQDWNRTVVLGNVYDESLIELFNNQNYRKVRRFIKSEDMPDDFICRKCHLWINEKA